MLRIIGLMSGTSVDGIDAALVEISGATIDLHVQFLAGLTYPYPKSLQNQILAVCSGASLSMAEFAELDDAIAFQFGQAALQLQAGHATADLIGSHGQTVFHCPPQAANQTEMSAQSSSLGYTLQLGRGAAIAHRTGITTISNFRVADIAAGGQGAPLVPPVDACLLSHARYTRCIQNLGGIGNVTYLSTQKQNAEQDSSSAPVSLATPILGWDTGPGNMLLDLAVQHFSNGTHSYDRDGAWAASGTPCEDLVNQWLQGEFFQQPPPKSTGRELFGQTYLQHCLRDADMRSLDPADILASLTELTAASISHSYRSFLPHMPDQVLLCGGGSKNLYLRQRLNAHLHPIPVLTTDEVGLNADFKEAIAFAVLAYWRYQGIVGNLPTVTGARNAVLLGEIHQVGRTHA
jgi:anhydro-N-acetylmuramic acid kinase